jgi:hypothetical protein
MNVEMADCLTGNLSLVDSYIESFSTPMGEFVLDDLQNSLKVSELLAGQIAQPANVPIGDQ